MGRPALLRLYAFAALFLASADRFSAATTEAPPEQHEDGYAEYKKAYKAFLVANSPDMRVPVLNAKQLAELDVPRLPNKFKALQGHPAYITGQLKPFQIEGVNFMY